MSALSPQGLAVLHALANTTTQHYDHEDVAGLRTTLPAGELTVAALVRHVRRPGASIGVTRASLSRTLRRLWRDGLVELSAEWAGWGTMTDRRDRDRKAVADHEADPVAAYAGYQGFVASIGLNDRHGSVEAFMAAQRARLCRAPNLRVKRVQITTAGRERLTTARTTKLTDDADTTRLTSGTNGELTDLEASA